LKHKNILAPYVLFNFNKGLAIWKCTDFAASEWNPHVIGNLVRQREIGRTAKNFHNIFSIRMFFTPNQTGKNARLDGRRLLSICDRSIKLDFTKQPIHSLRRLLCCRK